MAENYFPIASALSNLAPSQEWLDFKAAEKASKKAQNQGLAKGKIKGGKADFTARRDKEEPELPKDAYDRLSDLEARFERLWKSTMNFSQTKWPTNSVNPSRDKMVYETAGAASGSLHSAVFGMGYGLGEDGNGGPSYAVLNSLVVPFYDQVFCYDDQRFMGGRVGFIGRPLAEILLGNPTGSMGGDWAYAFPDTNLAARVFGDLETLNLLNLGNNSVMSLAFGSENNVEALDGISLMTRATGGFTYIQAMNVDNVHSMPDAIYGNVAGYQTLGGHTLLSMTFGSPDMAAALRLADDGGLGGLLYGRNPADADFLAAFDKPSFLKRIVALETKVAAIEGRLDDIDDEISSIKSRLTAGGL
jgi:hypothetical protein